MWHSHPSARVVAIPGLAESCRYPQPCECQKQNVGSRQLRVCKRELGSDRGGRLGWYISRRCSAGEKRGAGSPAGVVQQSAQPGLARGTKRRTHRLPGPPVQAEDRVSAFAAWPSLYELLKIARVAER